MIYGHKVKVNGKYYCAWDDVPEVEDMEGEEISLPFSDSDIELETTEKGYTKSEITLMKKAELLEIAKKKGLEGADSMSRAELVEYLLNLYGL